MDRPFLRGMPVPMVPSPNHSPRPAGVRPAVIVLHSTEGAYAGALRWLCHPASGASAHFLVARDGTAAQLVPLDRQAWHAGVSSWRERPHVNRCSIGIEMEHLDGKQDWPEAQLDAVAEICRWLMARYGLPYEAIVGHAEVARPRGRKVDPVGFPWEDFRRRLRGEAPCARVGDAVIPGLLHDGRLYVPARDLCDALHVPCDWREDRHALIVG